MRLARYRLLGDETHRPRAGLVVGDAVVDVRDGGIALGMGPLPTTTIELIQAGPLAQADARRLSELALDPAIAEELLSRGSLFPLSEVRLLVPLGRPQKNVFCVGMNYREHAAETARKRKTPLTLPEFPMFFSKTPTSIVGPFDDIEVDTSLSSEWDWEGELAVIIGRTAKNVRPEKALDAVFGYCCINDVTARDLQRRYGQIFKGKSMDASSPMGPWIVTADELGDPRDSRIVTRVNGTVKQDGSIADMIFSIETIIHHLSLGTSLEPGDIIATGTPAGAGAHREPSEFLRPGDILETAIEGIGVMRNRVATG